MCIYELAYKQAYLFGRSQALTVPRKSPGCLKT